MAHGGSAVSGDYARWLASEAAAALAHDDPFACIPDSSAEYAGTLLELRGPQDGDDKEAGR
jgi:hypothetical protein